MTFWQGVLVFGITGIASLLWVAWLVIQRMLRQLDDEDE